MKGPEQTVVDPSLETPNAPNSGASPETRLTRLTLAAASLLALVLVAVIASGGRGISFVTATSIVKTEFTTSSTTPDTSTTNQSSVVVPSSERHLHLYTTVPLQVPVLSLTAAHAYVVTSDGAVRHTLTWYSSNGHYVRSLSDAVALNRLGYTQYPGFSHGDPSMSVATPDGKYLWILNRSMSGQGFTAASAHECVVNNSATMVQPGFLYRYSVKKRTVDHAVPVGFDPSDMVLAHGGRELVVANTCSRSLTVVHLTQRNKVTTVPLTLSPDHLARSATQDLVYVTDSRSNHVLRFAPSRDEVISTLHLTSRVGAIVSMANDARGLLVTSPDSTTLREVDRRSGRLLRSAQFHASMSFMVPSPDGTVLYVASPMSQVIRALSTADFSVLDSVVLTSAPSAMAYDPRTGNLWVALSNGPLDVFTTI